MKQLILLFFSMCLGSASLCAQDNAWFYLLASDTLVSPEFKSENDQLKYIGNDVKLKEIFLRHKIITFKKTYRKASKQNLNKTFFVISEKESLMDELLTQAPHIFVSGQRVPEEDKKIYEPNDYGLTSTIGENLGFQVNLDYYDFLELPKAWYYTTGSRSTVVGISDGTVDTTNTEFRGKTKVYNRSIFSNAHGSGVAAIAAAQGDNAFGIPGVCYDCSIAATKFGSFESFEELVELSNEGVKVINCSWVGERNSENGQAIINKIYNNGTLVVAAAGNKNWIQVDKGRKLYYPASYDNVISVSTAMYKHEKVADNIEQMDGYFYGENIKGYLGRTVGFKDNDTLKPYHIYPVSVATLNERVDILAPSAGIFSLGRFVKNGSEQYISIEATSPATPLVTGTIALMLSLYPCLAMDEIESILKITSWNIDDIEMNKPYIGKYGSGILNTGKAVEMVYRLYSAKQTIYIQDQNFSRWDFKLTSLSKEVHIRNQKFTGESTLDLKAKNKIIIGRNTVLKPNTKGRLSFKIDPELQKDCELQLRDPSIED